MAPLNIAQIGFELLGLSGPPTSASQVACTTGTNHCSWLHIIYKTKINLNKRRKVGVTGLDLRDFTAHREQKGQCNHRREEGRLPCIRTSSLPPNAPTQRGTPLPFLEK
jgi:hypothetical protein